MKIGLVDELAEDKAEAISKCKSHLLELAKAKPEALFSTKLWIRKHVIDRFKKNQDEDAEEFARIMTRPQIQKSLGEYLQSLQKK